MYNILDVGNGCIHVRSFLHRDPQDELRLAEKRSSRPSAELIQLQREVERLKVSGHSGYRIVYTCTCTYM